MTTFYLSDGIIHDVSDEDINILKNESNFICDLFDLYYNDLTLAHNKHIIKLDIHKMEFKIILDYFKHDSSFSSKLSLNKKIKVLSASNYLMIDSIIEYITDEIADIIRCSSDVDSLREIFMCNTENDKKWTLRLPSIKNEFKWCKKHVLSSTEGEDKLLIPSGKILNKLYSETL